MNIMIIASWYPTPEHPINGVFFQERARALARSGCNVSVAVADVRFRMHGKHAGITETCNCGVTEFRYLKRNLTPFSEKGIALQQIPMIRKIYKLVCEKFGKPDVIHLESAKVAMAAVALAREAGIPLTYTEHSSALLKCTPGSYHDKLVHLAAEQSSHIFCISSAMKNKIAPPDGKWSYLPNAIDFSQFTLAQPQTPFTFCALGSLRMIKGYDILLRAFQQVHNRYPDTRLIIGGAGEEWAALHDLCEALDLTSCVEFPGSIPLEGRNDFYRPASTFVCSSHTETFSVVTVEALACGIPVIATRCGGPEDIVNDSNGILVDKNSVPALAEGMIQMINKRNEYPASAIRANAYNIYSEDNVVKKQIACFTTLVVS